jgi:mono/diheme cytochrome c family protein
MQRAPLVAIAIAATLVGAEMRAASPGTPPTRAHLTGWPEADGKAIYLQNCKQCHGVLGEPTKTAKAQYKKVATFRDPDFFKTRSDEALTESITKGKGEMKGFGDKLTKEEIQALVAYIHTLEKKG